MSTNSFNNNQHVKISLITYESFNSLHGSAVP